MRKRAQAFSTLRSEGGLLPPDLLQKLTQVPPGVQGVDPASYELAPGERLNESILQSWNRLQKSWKDFASKKERLQNPATTTGFTNQSWTLPLLKELQFGALPQVSAPQVNGKTYAVERLFSHSPIHLVGYAVDLDRRTPGVRGASSASPHALLQELLNRFPTFQWGLLCNGVSLRILRKNQALSRQSFLEFDLETMFAGEVYPDFVLFWLVAHATRFAPRQPDRPETCWLESWSQTAQKEGTRAMTELRAGVEKALQALGEGLSSHPANTKLRERLRSGTLDANELHAQLLRVVYRLIFLFVSEDRELEGQSVLHPIDPTPAGKTARERYAAYYGTARLRDMAGKIQGSEHGDLWQQLQLLCRALSGDPELEDARRALALPALGSLLWDPASTEALNDCQLSNHDLLQTLRHLAYTRQGNVLRAVDYRNMGAEELSGLYESLLGLTPELSADGAGFHFVQYAGNERKTSGAYYTPDALVQSLLDSALEPVLQNAIAGKDPETAANAILQLKVCDPAVGPGHFLVGAAHRLAHHLASQRALQAGEAQPTASDHQHALREVIAHCLYGVDINPMAAELCRVSLWLEAMEPGKPLTFLDHHVRVGNSLLGATPQLISAGIPDDAFQAITGDDKAAVRELKKQNQKHARGLGPLFAQEDAKARQKLFEAAAALDAMDDAQLDDVRGKGKKFRELLQSTAFQNAWQLADLWCAAFVVPKLFEPSEPQPGFQLEGNPDQTQSQTGLFQEPPRRKTPKAKTPSGNNPPRGITNRHLAAAAQGKPLPEALSHQVKELAQAYAFFHWHLAFPEVFARGGFDCVLGNPPWE
ncbi:MAG TPA: N-6 DNA methylase, partial [Thermotogota bacterium]|nr:N-6 DNA methylase [Thermotogota bacterium]